jgi:hypothetical protein
MEVPMLQLLYNMAGSQGRPTNGEGVYYTQGFSDGIWN